MPTSNATDTNNNSNQKILNGRSVDLMTVAGANTGGLASQHSFTVRERNNSNSQQTISETSTLHLTNYVNLIKNEHQHLPTSHIILNSSQHQLNNNNNNNNNNTVQQQQPQQQQQQQNQQNPSNQIQFQNQIQNNQHRHITHQQNQIDLPKAAARSTAELSQLLKDLNFDRTSLSNEELIKLVREQHVSVYKLETFLGKDNAARCVSIRREYYRLALAELDKRDPFGVRDRSQALERPICDDFEYEKINGACCENVIGYVRLPVGLAGPLVLDGENFMVPLATTEGCLVASTCRGLSALRKSGGVTSRVRRDFMTRAPIVRFIDSSLRDALDNVDRAIAWLNDKTNKEKMQAAFNRTSKHGKFINYTMYPVSREIHIRFEAQTGDAMGMNMCSKGVESALKEMQRAFPSMEIVTLSGNMCTDKKAAGINWINGRGKSVECNAELPANVVQQVFKVSVDSMIDRWKSKVMVGSALAASIGGFNSQAANILTAIFIATGQDPAQSVTSSNCMLILEKDSKGSLVVCCTMPSIECGTVGGGTILADQSSNLQVMGIKGPTPEQPIEQPQKPLVNGDLRKETSQNSLYIDNSLHQNTKVQSKVPPPQPPTSSSSSPSISSTSSSSPGNMFLKPHKPSAESLAKPSLLVTSPQPPPITKRYTNAKKLASIICATVMAGELSLLAALAEGTLVKSHMRHNRSSQNVTANSLSMHQPTNFN